ncbi:hypothetical protein D0861_01844 [Hortaea werneckii]|uniref:Uncharacterized protein n=1 Tax=Hortaea werneckii TaxID=91943 RepID=A0A3M7FXX9_HORWE|nr:hypothetical protein D0861_01844 [Hortaea werneckii]
MASSLSPPVARGVMFYATNKRKPKCRRSSECFRKIRIRRTDLAFAFLAATAPPHAALNVTFCPGSQCEQHSLGSHQLYESMDIRSNHVGDYDNSILRSFEIVRLDAEGNYPPYGYCGIRHGDSQSFRGRNWRWQQIAMPSNGTDYDRHGAVPSNGRYKQHQISDHSWKHIPLEEWDDQVHINNSWLPMIQDFAAEEVEEPAIEQEEEEAGTKHPLASQDTLHEYL